MATLTAVLLDNQEPEWVQGLKFRDVTPTVAHLPIGDAWLTTDAYTCIVERKAAGDLVNSVIDGALLNQGARMMAEAMFQWRYLVYTAPEIRQGFVVLNGRATQMTWRRIAGVLVDLQEMGIACVPIGADSEYGATLEWLATRNHGDVRVSAHRRKGVMETPQEHFLSSMPGISETRAAALMEHCSTAAWSVNWLTQYSQPVGNVPGIGNGTRRTVRAMLGLKDDEYLAVCADVHTEKENQNE